MGNMLATGLRGAGFSSRCNFVFCFLNFSFRVIGFRIRVRVRVSVVV